MLSGFVPFVHILLMVAVKGRLEHDTSSSSFNLRWDVAKLICKRGLRARAGLQTFPLVRLLLLGIFGLFDFFGPFDGGLLSFNGSLNGSLNGSEFLS
jgi:hypothetical protein